MQNFLKLLVSSSAQGLALQYVLLVLGTLVFIYAIIAMRLDSVVVLSHGRLIFSVLIANVACMVYYRGSLWLDPQRKHFYIAIILVAVWAGIVNVLVLVVDQRKSLRDTAGSEGDYFNCNWPLIRRCAIQTLGTLLVVSYWAVQKPS